MVKYDLNRLGVLLAYPPFSYSTGVHFLIYLYISQGKFFETFKEI